MKVWEIEKKIADEIKAACQPIEAAIRDKYRPMLEEASQKEAEYLELTKKTLMQEALKAALWPSQTRLIEWNRGLRHGPEQWRQTGRIGLYEIYDEKSSAPTVPDRPHATAIIRLLRKDGTPGTRILNWVDWTSWLPEGEHPDTYKHPSRIRKTYEL